MLLLTACQSPIDQSTNAIATKYRLPNGVIKECFIDQPVPARVIYEGRGMSFEDTTGMRWNIPMAQVYVINPNGRWYVGIQKGRSGWNCCRELAVKQ